MAELSTGTHEVDVEHITLKGPDGAPIDAIHARPDGMPHSGLVVHPDIMGVRPLFDDLCRRLVAKDYYQSSDDFELAGVMRLLAHLEDEELLDLNLVAGVLHLDPEIGIDGALQPRGFRLLHKIPRLPELVSDHVVDRFSNLQKIMRAGLTDLTEVEGVGEVRAKAIKEGLSRLAETSILERYV